MLSECSQIRGDTRHVLSAQVQAPGLRLLRRSRYLTFDEWFGKLEDDMAKVITREVRLR
jgi:hypothetical protein